MREAWKGDDDSEGDEIENSRLAILAIALLVLACIPLVFLRLLWATLTNIQRAWSIRPRSGNIV